MLKKRVYRLVSLVVFFMIPSISAYSLPIVDQTGNLLLNGNFESGTTSIVTSTGERSSASAFDNWNAWVIVGPEMQSQQITSEIIDGDYAARISGNYGNEIWQYASRPGGVYTASAWVYVVSGSAVLDMAWNNGGLDTNTAPVTELNRWVYLELTATFTPSFSGVVLSTFGPDSEFYVDGVWLNAGNINLSPYALQNGFADPNPAPVPEPATIILIGAGLIGLARLKKISGR